MSASPDEHLKIIKAEQIDDNDYNTFPFMKTSPGLWPVVDYAVSN